MFSARLSNFGHTMMTQTGPRHSLATRFSAGAFVFIVVFGLVFVNSFSPLFDSDIWTHLKTGEIIVTNKSIPTMDLFTSTAHGQKTPPISWLFQVIVYLIYSWKGAEWLSLFGAIVFSVCFASYALLFFSRKTPFLAIIVSTLSVLIAIRYRIILRPHLISMCMMLLLLIFIRTINYKRWWALFPFFALWSNFHGEVILGIVTLFIFVLNHLMSRSGFKSILPATKHAEQSCLGKYLYAFSTLCCLAIFINPAGVDIVSYASFHSSLIKVYEFHRLSLYRHPEVIPLLVLFVLSMCVSWKRVDFNDILMIVFFAILAFRYERSIPYMGFVMLPVIIKGGEWLQSNCSRRSGIAALTFLVLLLSVINYRSIAHSDNQPYGWGIRRYMGPWPIIDFLDQNMIEGPVLNSNDLGSFIIWTSYPRRPVLSDGRQLLHKDIHERILSFSRSSENLETYFDNWETIAKEYNCDYAIAGYEPPEHQGLASFLRARWKLVYWDDQAQLFIRPGSRFQSVIDRYEIVGFGPEGVFLPINPSTAISTLEKVLDHDPDVAITRYMLAIYLNRTGQTEKAHSELKAILRFRPNFAPARKLVRNLNP